MEPHKPTRRVVLQRRNGDTCDSCNPPELQTQPRSFRFLSLHEKNYCLTNSGLESVRWPKLSSRLRSKQWTSRQHGSKGNQAQFSDLSESPVLLLGDHSDCVKFLRILMQL